MRKLCVVEICCIQGRPPLSQLSTVEVIAGILYGRRQSQALVHHLTVADSGFVVVSPRPPPHGGGLRLFRRQDKQRMRYLRLARRRRSSRMTCDCVELEQAPGPGPQESSFTKPHIAGQHQCCRVQACIGDTKDGESNRT